MRLPIPAGLLVLFCTAVIGCAHVQTIQTASEAAPVNTALAGAQNGRQPTTRSEGRRSSHAAASGRYLRARGWDLVDVFELRYGIDYSLAEADWEEVLRSILIPEADVRATCLAHLAAGFSTRVTSGIGNGVNGAAMEEVVGFPFTNLGMVHDMGGPLIVYARIVDPETSSEGYNMKCGVVPLLMTADREGRLGMPLNVPGYPPIRWADVGVGTALFPLAFDVGFSPGEFLDFLAGWAGFDPAGDDKR